MNMKKNRLGEVPEDHIRFSLRSRISRVVCSVQSVSRSSISKVMLFPSHHVFHTLNQNDVLLLVLIFFLHHFAVLLLYRQWPEQTFLDLMHFFSRLGQFQQLLKTQVILILNFMRIHCDYLLITYGQNY